MAKADKATAVADIAEQFKESTATVVTEYRGLTVANLAELRRSLAAKFWSSLLESVHVVEGGRWAANVAAAPHDEA